MFYIVYIQVGFDLMTYILSVGVVGVNIDTYNLKLPLSIQKPHTLLTVCIVPLIHIKLSVFYMLEVISEDVFTL